MINLLMRDSKPWGQKNEIPAEESPIVSSIPIELIRPNPYQPRKNFTEQGLDELRESIKQYGVLQPINVRRINNNGYELIAGERRLRAARMAGLTHIPAMVINAYEQDSAIIALIENLQREDLHYMEEAEGYLNLIKDHGFTQEELATKLGKSQSTIANKLRILRLPKSVKDMLVESNLTERHARALLRIHDEDTQRKLIQQIVQKNLNVKRTEELVEKILDKIVHEKEKDHVNKKKITRIYRDYRLFVNTMKNAVKAMKDAGVAAQYSQEDKENCIEIRVIIPKA